VRLASLYLLRDYGAVLVQGVSGLSRLDFWMRDGVVPIPGAVRQRLPDDGQTPFLWAEGAHDSGSLVSSCFLFLSFFFQGVFFPGGSYSLTRMEREGKSLLPWLGSR
jgi:hypothetical protein